MALQSIENSLNYENGLGTLSLSLLYGTNFLSALFIGPPLIHILTPKWTMVLCFLAHSFFIVAHFWNSKYILFSASFILGIAFSPSWVANGTYLTVIATRYSVQTGQDFDKVVQRFNSIFYMMYSLHAIPGNIASSLILSHSQGENQDTNMFASEVMTTLLPPNDNYTSNPISSTRIVPKSLSSESNNQEQDISICGANHCPYIESHTYTFETPSTDLLYTLLGCLLVLNVIGVLLCVCLPSGIKTDKKFTRNTIFSAFKVRITINNELIMSIAIEHMHHILIISLCKLIRHMSDKTKGILPLNQSTSFEKYTI